MRMCRSFTPIVVVGPHAGAPFRMSSAEVQDVLVSKHRGAPEGDVWIDTIREWMTAGGHGVFEWAGTIRPA